jgi:isocitrate dehydrogenase
MSEAADVSIEHIDSKGKRTVLKQSTPLLKGEVIDSTYMSKKALCNFYDSEFTDAKDTGMLMSLHLKATMMKKSDPILFGHAVKSYFKNAFTKHEQTLRKINANPNNGLASVLASINEKLSAEEAAVVIGDFNACYESGPSVAMVNSAKGITNLHVPSDVIIDASVPNVVRDSGKMWNKDNELQDTKVVIPDRSYA